MQITTREFLIVLLVGCTMLAEAANCRQSVVRLPENPKPTELTAAKELTEYLVRHGGECPAVFHVGDTAFAEEHSLASASFERDGWAVKAFGRDVIVNGGGPHGVLYAAWHFLEEVCGVRWWSNVEEEILHPGEPIAVAGLDLHGVPAFRLRDIYLSDTATNMVITSFRHRNNGSYSELPDPAMGGGFYYGSPGSCHTFEGYVPAAEHFAAHPEWFSFVKRTGQRAAGQTSGQLCLMNREVRELVKRRLRGFIARDRALAAERGIPPPYVYDISENDNWNYCECEECERALAKWGRSGVMLDFINEIADSVSDDFPEILVNTFAYHGTENPPIGGKRARDNVMIRLCDTKTSIVGGHFEPDNRVFSDFLAGWLKCAKNISIWDYAINYTKATASFPMPSEGHYAELFRFCRDRGVFGFFWEHENFDAADLWELKYSLETKLMENPDLDAGELTRTFLREYYGPAAETIVAYRAKLDAVRRANHGRVGWFPSLEDFDWIAEEDLADFERMATAAMAAVKGDELHSRRVRRAFLGVRDLRRQRDLRAGRGEGGPERISDDFYLCTDTPPRTIYHFDREEHRAWRCDLKTEEGPERLPVLTVRDAAGKVKATLAIPAPAAKPEYAVISLGRVRFEAGDQLWLRPDGRLRYAFTHRPSLLGRDFDLRLRVRFTGAGFEPDSVEPRRVWLGEIVLGSR